MTDTVEQIETPEGIKLSLRLAGAPVRSKAYLIDWLIRVAISMGVGIGCSFLGAGGQGIALVIYFLLEWFYPVYFEVKKSGQTPGKKSANIRVLNANGTPVTVQSSVIRNFLRIADFFPFAYAAGICSIFCDRKMRRLGDLAAGTVVVYCKEGHRRRTKLPNVEEERPPVQLTTDEQEAVIAFAERATHLTHARQDELATILCPIHKLNGKRATKRVQQYATSLTGQR